MLGPGSGNVIVLFVRFGGRMIEKDGLAEVMVGIGVDG